MEWDDISRLVYAQLGLVYDLPGTRRNRGGQLQYHCTHNHLGPVHAQHALENAGLLLLCHSRGIGTRVSWWLINGQ